MGRSRKDAPAADGSGDPAPADLDEEAEESAEEEQSQEEEDGEGDEEWEADEEEDQEDGEEASGETGAQDKAEGSPQKLAEGFFEIEAIRRRRRHRGQLQYLVKWRGWPESESTWEPFENLKACSDLIEAFEKRSRTPRSSRKRKRKTTATPTNPNPSRGKRGRPPRSEARSLPRPPAPEPKTLSGWTSTRRTRHNSNKTSFGGPEVSVNELGRRVMEEASSDVVSVGFPPQGTHLSVSLTHNEQDEHHTVKAIAKEDNLVQAPSSQGGQVTGAKKRKSGCVKRFKLDEVVQEHGAHRDRTSEKAGNEYVDSTEGEIVDKNKGEEYGNQVHITKIIKPVRYFATIMDGMQQVSITFKALRSNGEEVLVDDKQLKANHPLVLIDFYEQHLRYNPTS